MTPAKGYMEMKDSGIEWVGMIPAHWGICKIKYTVTQETLRAENNGGYIGLENVESWSGKIIDKHNENVVVEGASLAVCPNDILFGKLRPYLAKCAIAEKSGCCSTEFIVMRPHSIEGRFLKYVMLTPQFIDMVNMSTYGAKMPRANWDFIGNALLAMPSRDEQAAIASYLDAQCAKIDEIIAQAKASIEDYKQWKVSIIYEAVTKGLDPNVEMKDGGIEWIPLLPTAIKVSRVGLHFSIILGKMLCPKPLDDTYTLEPYFCAANVHFSGVDSENLKEMWFNPDEKERYRVAPGDLLVVEGGAGAGGCAVIETVDFPIYIQNSIMIVRSKRKNNVKYLKYFLETLVGRGYIDFACNKATIPHFTKEKLSAVPFPVFDCDTQARIVDFLDSKCGKIDDLIFQKQSLIDDLESYKKSLIYEVVTGKRYIR